MRWGRAVVPMPAVQHKQLAAVAEALASSPPAQELDDELIHWQLPPAIKTMHYLCTAADHQPQPSSF